METKRIAIIGFGGRGRIYGQFALDYPEKFSLVAVADIDEERLQPLKEKGVKTFLDYKELLNANFQLDLVVISTQDALHKEQALYAMEKGYDLLLEKPVATTKEECLEIYEYAKARGRRVYVCHVLRYSPFYQAIKDVIDEGTLGEIVNIHALEGVGYYHHAHSYVRGPWRKKEESSPMILAKCCHDMDIIRYLVGEKCISVNSYGSRKFFREENAPEGAAQYCSACPHSETCTWNAQKLYTTDGYRWTAEYFLNGEKTDENILRALKGTQYDKCVFLNDNNVVDHQSTVISFENGKTAVHTMTAFSQRVYRDIKIFGTKAELYGHMEDSYIEIRPFGKEVQRIDIDISRATLGGHSGSDFFMMEQLYNHLNGVPSKGITYLDVSIESHLMSFAAEESRLNGGAPCLVEK